MKELSTEIEIEAPGERVWQLLTDFNRFPQWNPFIRQASGELKEGAVLNVQLQPPGMSGMNISPTVIKAEANHELRWLGQLFFKGFFDGEHIFEIEELESGRVRFIQREIFRGLLVPVFGIGLESSTRRGFEAMNRALKERAECMAADSAQKGFAV